MKLFISEHLIYISVEADSLVAILTFRMRDTISRVYMRIGSQLEVLLPVVLRKTKIG